MIETVLTSYNALLSNFSRTDKRDVNFFASMPMFVLALVIVMHYHLITFISNIFNSFLTRPNVNRQLKFRLRYKYCFSGIAPFILEENSADPITGYLFCF